ncbi:glutathione S-transferase [Roseibium sp. Sym1]|uniref:glutathione S-transferase n=1 Tax=Roseibium sp. Sym1 TaxID=3016006 RepID=UPI0022B4DCDD|nr:glutathione S-transferase [Roseibium sp. Sym1]
MKDGELTVWDSLAILECVAECHPETCLWPEDRAERAKARAISAEMHAGFAALRGAFPMNMRSPSGKLEVSDAVKADVAWIVGIWTECLDLSGGPFIFGDFTIADAMYAPVVSRFAAYGLSSDPVVERYHAAMIQTPAWQSWLADAVNEPWVVEEEEV